MLQMKSKSLFMFAGVCIAGYSSSTNEILELCLPPKLFADENKVRKHPNSPNVDVYYAHIIQIFLSPFHSTRVLCSGFVCRAGLQSCPWWPY